MIERLRISSQSLTFRIAALLAVTLLPIGLISVSQTYMLVKEADNNARSSLLALTAEAAAGEEAFIRTAFGAAQAIAATVPRLREVGWDCEDYLKGFLSNSGAFSFAGYVGRDGIVTCASGGEGMDVSNLKLFKDMQNTPEPRVAIVLDAPVSQTSVVVVAVPVMKEGKFDGYVGVSLPHRQLFRPYTDLSDNRPIDLITFNADAVVLTAEGGLENVSSHLPLDRELSDLVRLGKTSFIGETHDGSPRVFASVPIVAGTVYALGSWPHERGALLSDGVNATTSILFPIAMWLACLMVAFFAVQRMVIRPTRNLQARMLHFMRSKRISPPKHENSTPRELREMNATWQLLAESVLRDEADLHNAIHEKTVLLKEVHHRVKNNLQLIASILNMKMRKSKTSDIKAALNDIQQRVMSIARVHQKLYETSTEERVRADELLNSIVNQILDAAMLDKGEIQVTQSYDPMVVYPDQAVPLTLAVSELVTNSLKYLGRPEDGKPWLSVRLENRGDDGGTLELSNSLGPLVTSPAENQSSGLGEQLIRAFVQQMEGRISDETDGKAHRVVIQFPIAEFDDTLLSPDWAKSG